jgi:hypothetical protein
VMDVMRHVPDVDVVGPAALREAVIKKLSAGMQKMMPGSCGELAALDD